MSSALRHLGSLDWAERTHGRLLTEDRLHILAKALLARIQQLLPRSTSGIQVDVNALPWPGAATGAVFRALATSELQTRDFVLPAP